MKTQEDGNFTDIKGQFKQIQAKKKYMSTLQYL